MTPYHLEKFQQSIDVSFHNSDLLKEALTHRSYLNEHPSWSLPHNERLEFLGDAVLELIVTRALFDAYPTFEEGKLTGVRAALVNCQMLFSVANSIGLGDFILMSRGEAKEGGKARESLLADAFEALLGAIYLDGGYDAARLFVERHVLPNTKDILQNNLYKDAKSAFQEYVQEKFKVTPTYKILKEIGPDHSKEFHVGVFIDKKQIATGQGMSKQEAEQEAAKNGLYVFEKTGN
jgi:ribonuclease III